MEKKEIKKFSYGSVARVSVYFAIIPAILYGLLLLIGVVGTFSSDGGMLLFTAIGAIVGMGLFIGIYVVIALLSTLLYNLFAGKFGGLVITVKDKVD
ncbi:hypothetical protein [Virgibacillus pantothenticus]|uniref:hypothetical protein n=1 Tax=Virgibacillus pantothenticus TaxID=1473 RepID=UPI000985D4B4|nr:hypothetical protein [Virgibacillus pantothenticus]